MSEQLQTLLQQLKTADGTLESHGEFLIDLKKARDKLKKYQLKQPSYYLLKLIQAATSADAREIDINLRGRNATITIALDKNNNNPITDSSKVLQALTTNNTLQEQSALNYLAVALNSSWGMDPEKISWSYETEAGGWRLTIEPDDLNLEDLKPNPELDHSQHYYVKFHLERSANISNYLKNIADEHDSIIARSAFGRIPIILNQKLLLGSWGSPKEGDWHKNLCPPLFLLERYECDEKGKIKFPCPKDIFHLSLANQGGQFINTEAVAVDQGHHAPTFCTELTGPIAEDNMIYCKAALAVPLALTGPATIFFLQKGVTLEPIEYDLGLPGALIVAEGDDLNVDLTGFKAREDDKLKQHLEYLKRLASAASTTILSLTNRLPAHSYKTADPTTTYAGYLIGCIFGGPLGGIALGWLAKTLSRSFPSFQLNQGNKIASPLIQEEIAQRLNQEVF